jgi:amino acid transporter
MNSAATTHLDRRIGLRSAVALNMMDMIGVGPFITLPLVIAAAGASLSVWAWLLGAGIAVADGLVWAELGAAFPQAGGSYRFLRMIYGESRLGKWLSFLFVWQVSFSAPLSIASGCIGLSGFLAWFWPALDRAPIDALPALHYTNLTAALVCLLVTALLYRNLSSTTKLAWLLFAGVLAAIAGVLVSGVAHAVTQGGWQFPATGVSAGLPGLARATLLATYCYWGYYNICFLGAEVRHPTRTIPRAVLLSVVFVSVLYVAMNLAVLPSITQMATTSGVPASSLLRLQLVAEIAGSAFGRWAGVAIAALIIWAAFSSLFSLLLGYSRVPYAAAVDGNYFEALGKLHPKLHIPSRSLIALGVVASFFCFFSLTQVITLLVVTRILLQFFPQQIGVIFLRFSQPDLNRPYKMPLFPLPPVLAIAGFLFLLVEREQAMAALLVTAAIAVTGTLLFLWRARNKGEWPFIKI